MQLAPTTITVNGLIDLIMPAWIGAMFHFP
jgi:hypothetical protein